MFYRLVNCSLGGSEGLGNHGKILETTLRIARVWGVGFGV